MGDDISVTSPAVSGTRWAAELLGLPVARGDREVPEQGGDDDLLAVGSGAHRGTLPALSGL
jgi:hypothetical protein